MAIDWELFNNDLLNELSGYASLMEYEKIDLNKAISVFFNFIRNSKNANLSSKLPHNLYEFCRARNNRFDLDTYVSNLAIFYEGLLCDILNRKQKLQPNSSFREIALKFPDLAHALKAPHPEGFEKIFDDLYNKRNMVVHGYSLDLNTAETAKCILDFTALYIFTVAKYATKS